MSDLDPAHIRIAEASNALSAAVMAMVERWMAEGHSKADAVENTRSTVSLVLNDEFLAQEEPSNG